MGGMGHPQQMQQQQQGGGGGQSSSVPANQTLTNQTQQQLAQMNPTGPLSIQLSHGQMVGGQSTQTGPAQMIMPPNNASAMFQVKQSCSVCPSYHTPSDTRPFCVHTYYWLYYSFSILLIITHFLFTLSYLSPLWPGTLQLNLLTFYYLFTYISANHVGDLVV